MVGLWGLFAVTRAAAEVSVSFLQPSRAGAPGRSEPQDRRWQDRWDVFIEAESPTRSMPKGSQRTLEFFTDDAEARRIETYKDGLMLKLRPSGRT